jgi:hypothetical protein
VGGDVALWGQVKSRKYRGVFFDPAKGLWLAHCHMPGGVRRLVGGHRTEDVAARAYDRSVLTNLGSKKGTLNFNRQDYADLLEQVGPCDAPLEDGVALVGRECR